MVKKSPYQRYIFVATVSVTLAFGTIDTLNILGLIPAKWEAMLVEYMPLYSAHASWFLPCLTTLLFSILANASLSQRRKETISMSAK